VRSESRESALTTGPGARARLPRDAWSLARIALVAIFVAVALLSVVREWPNRWDAFGREHATFAGQPAPPPLAYAARSIAIDPAVLDFYAARLHPGERYAFQVPPDLTAGSYQGLLEISAVALLPAIGVEDSKDADVLLSYDADPRPLRLPFASEQFGSAPYYVTRTRP
jgi:hypothetical protein